MAWSEKQYRDSLKVWEEREERFRKNWRSKKKGDPRRAYWFGMLKNAKAWVARRRKEVAKFDKAGEISDRGLAKLIQEEGSVPYAYNDPAGHATFGVGHLIHLGPVTAADRAKWGTKGSPRRDLVMPTLRKDIRKFEEAVEAAVKVPLKQWEFDALVSLAFNIGTGGFSSSTVVKRLNAGDRKGAADAFLMWDNPSMLRPRRERERKLFLTGNYS